MPNLPTPDALQVALTCCTLLVIWIGWAKIIGPPIKGIFAWIKDLIAVFVGRPERFDRVTGKPVEKVPSLIEALVQIRDKQDEQGKSINDLTTVVTRVADQQITLDEHTKQIADLRLSSAVITEQVGLLKRAADERTAMHKESAALMDMVTKRDSDVIDEEAP